MDGDAFVDWVAALEKRHLADLRLPEVTRALRALSSAYVERRQALQHGVALNSAGKRAAFALFYGPLHFLTTRHVLGSLNAVSRVPDTILDLGCGSGAAGAAWALECDRRPRVIGIDRHPATMEEARWTYRQLGIQGTARQGDIARIRPPRGELAIIAAYVLNEVPSATREAAWKVILTAARRGARVLVLEPIARALTPWWEDMTKDVTLAGGRADEWRFSVELPSIVQALDRSAGLNHREVTARSLYIPFSCS